MTEPGARPTAVGTDADAVIDAIVQQAFPGASLTRRPFAYATSSRLEEIAVCRAGHPPLRLVAKHLGRDAKIEAAQLAKPAALHSAGRELDVYRHILAAADLGTPKLVGGWAGADDDGVIVIERVEGTPLSEIGDFSVWEATARWLARMHARFAYAPQRISASAPGARGALVSYDRELLAARGRRGLQRASEQALGPAEMIVALGARHEYALRALSSATPTLVHGDFYPSNIVVTEERIAVVDWELAGIGPAVLDLAALAAGGWDHEQRHDLISAYHDEARGAGPVETLTALTRRTDLASLHLALHWVDSPPEWEAPDEHRRDWFGDAIAALDRLNGHTP